jgi:MFS family permease
MIPTYLLDYLKLTPQQMGFVASAAGFGGFLGQFSLPAISDLIGRKMAVLVAFVLAAIFLWASPTQGRPVCRCCSRCCSVRRCSTLAPWR